MSAPIIPDLQALSSQNHDTGVLRCTEVSRGDNLTTEKNERHNEKIKKYTYI